MNPLMIVTLIESCFAALEGLCGHLISSGVIPADHPVAQQVADAKSALADAKAIAAVQP